MAMIPVGTAVGYLTLDYSSFTKNLNTAVGEANSLSNKFADTLGSGLQTVGDKISTVGTTLTTGVTVPLATATASSVKFGAEFDKQMSAVKAVTNATEEDFNTMRDAAIDWGEKTVYTATEAGEALYYMGLAGWDAKTSVEALGPVLNLAAAGDLDLGRASDIVTDAMTAMKVEAGELSDGIENTAHFTNVLAAAMANSNTDVDLMGETFKYVSPLAGALNYDVRDLALGIGLMANVGVKGSQAGTGLRQALKNLIAPTEQMQIYMDKYNVSLYDVNGNAKSMRQLMEELRDTFGDLSIDIYDASGELKSAEDIMEEYGRSLPTTQQEKLNAIVEIFGTRALPGVLGIIEQSDDKFNSLADAIDGADTAFDGLGYAAGMAETQMDNLQGDWTRFTSALGTTQIIISDLVKSGLREFVQELTRLLNTFNNLDPSQQEAILKFFAMAAAIGPVILIIGKLISGLGSLIVTISQIGGAITKIGAGFSMFSAKIAELGSLFSAAGGSAAAAGEGVEGLAAALGGASATVAWVVAIIVALIAAFITLWKTNEEFRNDIISIWEDIKGSFEEAGQTIVDTLNEMGFEFEDIHQVISTVVEGIKTIWLAFCELLGPVFIAAFKLIGNAISTTLGLMTGLFEMFSGIIKGLQTGDWSLFFEGLTDIVDTFVKSITEPLDTVGQMIWDMISSVVGWFTDDWDYTWDEAKQAVGDMAVDVVDWFDELGEKISGFFTDLGEGLSTLPEDIAGWLLDAYDSVTDWGADMIEKAVEIGSDFVDSIVEFFEELPYNIGFAIGYVYTSVVKWKDDMIEKATELGTEFIQNIKDWFEQLPTKIEEFIETTKENVTIFVTDMVEKAKELGEEFINTIVEWFEQLPTKIEEFATTTWDNTVKFVDDMKAKAKEMGEEFINNVVTFFQELPGKVKQFFDDSISNAKQWVTDMGEKGKEAIENLKTNVKNAATNISEKVKSIGKNIVDGVWQGIKNAKDTFYRSVTGFFTGIVDGVQSALRIHSPSDVMADEVGIWLPPGVVEGVEDAMPEAIKDIQDIINEGVDDISVNKDIDTSLGLFSNTFEDTFNTVLSVLDNIEVRFIDSVDRMTNSLLRLFDVSDKLTSIKDMLSDFNNVSNINMFNNAYGNQFNMQELLNSLSIMFTNHITNIISAISNIRSNNNDSDNDGDIVIPIYIGDEIIDTYVITAQRRNDYRSGGR